MAIKPPLLQEGDTIGIVALGSPGIPQVVNIDVGIQTLRARGYQVVEGEHVRSPSFPVASARERANDLMNMFENRQVKMILPIRGGTGVADILPYLDYRIIAQNPKIISGYSDITVLVNALYQQTIIGPYTGLITFHGLMLLDFKPDTPPFNFNSFFAATSTTNAPRLIENPPGMPLVGRGESGVVRGEIVGGNITSLITSLGTPFDIDTRGKILLLEESHATTDVVYRNLSHLQLAGKLNDCVGIVMGQCTGCPASYGVTYEDIINRLLVPLGKPLLTNLATAHGTYKVTIPIGSLVEVNTVNNTLTALEPAVSGVGATRVWRI